MSSSLAFSSWCSNLRCTSPRVPWLKPTPSLFYPVIGENRERFGRRRLSFLACLFQVQEDLPLRLGVFLNFFYPGLALGSCGLLVRFMWVVMRSGSKRALVGVTWIFIGSVVVGPDITVFVHPCYEWIALAGPMDKSNTPCFFPLPINSITSFPFLRNVLGGVLLAPVVRPVTPPSEDFGTVIVCGLSVDVRWRGGCWLGIVVVTSRGLRCCCCAGLEAETMSPLKPTHNVFSYDRTIFSNKSYAASHFLQSLWPWVSIPQQ